MSWAFSGIFIWSKLWNHDIILNLTWHACIENTLGVRWATHWFYLYANSSPVLHSEANLPDGNVSQHVYRTLPIAFYMCRKKWELLEQLRIQHASKKMCVPPKRCVCLQKHVWNIKGQHGWPILSWHTYIVGTVLWHLEECVPWRRLVENKKEEFWLGTHAYLVICDFGVWVPELSYEYIEHS